MVLWTDASVYEDEKPPVAAIAVVEPEYGIIHVARLVRGVGSSSAAEREAVLSAFRIARGQPPGTVVIRTDCSGTARLTPPRGVCLQHRPRTGNPAHAPARRVARQELHLRALDRRDQARRNMMPQALRDRPTRPA